MLQAKFCWLLTYDSMFIEMIRLWIRSKEKFWFGDNEYSHYGYGAGHALDHSYGLFEHNERKHRDKDWRRQVDGGRVRQWHHTVRDVQSDQWCGARYATHGQIQTMTGKSKERILLFEGDEKVWEELNNTSEWKWLVRLW